MSSFRCSAAVLLVCGLGASFYSTLAIANLPYHSVAASSQAVEFAPGVISTNEHFEINTVLNQAGDWLLFSRCADDFSRCTMMESHFVNGQWQQPKALPFSGGYLEGDPFFNEDESLVYFVSQRPLPGEQHAASSVNLWRVAIEQGEWQTPEYLESVSSAANDLYPSITAAGDLFFPSFRNGQRLLYQAKKQGNGFETPQPISAEIYGENASIGDTVILPDGNTIIFSISGRADSAGKGDLYISHKVNGEWSLAKSLGEQVNTPAHEFTPIMSPNGEYLFFTRVENGRGNLYQIHVSALPW